jgi:hypothetical protein
VGFTCHPSKRGELRVGFTCHPSKRGELRVGFTCHPSKRGELSGAGCFPSFGGVPRRGGVVAAFQIIASVKRRLRPPTTPSGFVPAQAPQATRSPQPPRQASPATPPKEGNWGRTSPATPPKEGNWGRTSPATPPKEGNGAERGASPPSEGCPVGAGWSRPSRIRKNLFVIFSLGAHPASWKRGRPARSNKNPARSAANYIATSSTGDMGFLKSLRHMRVQLPLSLNNALPQRKNPRAARRVVGFF